MKKTKKIFGSIFILAMGVSLSCKDTFLEVAPTTSLTESQLTSLNGLEGALIGAYSMLSGRGGFYSGSTNWMWGSILGGDANKGTNSGDQSQVNELQAYNAQTTNGSVSDKYRATYEGIARVNGLLRVLPDADKLVTAETKTRIEAEAKFLRGHYYFELKRLYDDTPYVTENDDYTTGIQEIGNAVDLWPKIEQDFQFAVDNLPEKQGATGRANVWAAKAYLAKVYLYQKKYDKAKVLFDDVIANGTTGGGKKYDLVKNYGDLFRIASDVNEEVVFAIQSAAGTGTINNANPEFVLNFPYNGGPAGCCGFFQPSFELTNSFRTKNGLPLLDGTYNLPANELSDDEGVSASAEWKSDLDYKKDDVVTVMAPGNVATQYKALVASKGADPLTAPASWAVSWQEDTKPLDPRIDFSVGRRGVPYLDHGRHPGAAWIRDQNYGGPFAPKKYIWSKAEEATGGVDKSSWTPGYSALNINLIRFADVLLMAAEVEVELGNLEVAREYVNRVRTRAANAEAFVMDGAVTAANYDIATYVAPWIDAAVARDAVRFERKLELSGEGHRFFDLVRWGTAETVLNNYIDYESSKVTASPFQGAKFTAKSRLMPLPQSEVDLIGPATLVQNPGY